MPIVGINLADKKKEWEMKGASRTYPKKKGGKNKKY